MRTIQLQVEDKDYESFLTIVNSLKKGMIKNFQVKTTDTSYSNFEQTKSFFNQCLQDIENGNTKLLSQEDYTIQMDNFRKDLESKYASN